MVEQPAEEPITGIVSGDDQRVEITSEFLKAEPETSNEARELQERAPVMPIDSGYTEATVCLAQHELFPEIRLVSAFGEGRRRAAKIAEGSDLLFVVENEVSGPGTSFKVKIHRQEPDADGFGGV